MIQSGAKRGRDYAYYQKAISYGFLKQTSQKIAALNDFVTKYPKSKLGDDALYELGNSYVQTNSTQKALAMYDRLTNDYKASSFVPKALLKQGLIYYNEGNDDQALTKFQEVVNKYSGTEEAVQAVTTAKLIYVDQGRVEEYANWVKSLDFVDLTDTELDNATYESAEKQYLQNKFDLAVTAFENYNSKFPNGLHAMKSHFYLATSYNKMGNTSKAIPNYEYVISKTINEFTEESLGKLSEIYLASKDWDKAIPMLERLENEAAYDQQIVFAQSNLMKGYYEKGNYEKAVIYAEKVQSNAEVDANILSDAQIIIAKSAIKTGDEAKAKVAYQELQKTATGALMAEALYYDAYFDHQGGNYAKSNATVQRIAKEYSGYKEFGAKGLVLMARNFNKLGDAFQATYILESVIANFTEYPEVVTEAEELLHQIKQEQAKVNSSIEIEGQPVTPEPGN